MRQVSEFVREEIEHVRSGKHGARSMKQVIAIGLSKARRAGINVPRARRITSRVKLRAMASHASRPQVLWRTPTASTRQRVALARLRPAAPAMLRHAWQRCRESHPGVRGTPCPAGRICAREIVTRAAGMLGDRLRLMFDWFKGMVDEGTGRLLYLYDPENDVTIGDGEPIRDIAAIWDVKCSVPILTRRPRPLISARSATSAAHRQRDGCAVGTRGSPRDRPAPFWLSPSSGPTGAALTFIIDGILRQQKGRLVQIFFDSVPDSGEELYPAEAMLALLEAHRLTGDARHLESVERGFAHYKRDYYDRGRVESDFLVFFANWESQAGRLLFEATARPEVKDLVRAFLFELHDRIIESGFYDRVARTPEAQACVEVACGLEGLADAYAVAVSSRRGDYRRCIGTAASLSVHKCHQPQCTGAVFMPPLRTEQRIDVTGHVASGFIKSVSSVAEPAT
jgi:hypothetical protein